MKRLLLLLPLLFAAEVISITPIRAATWVLIDTGTNWNAPLGSRARKWTFEVDIESIQSRGSLTYARIRWDGILPETQVAECRTGSILKPQGMKQNVWIKKAMNGSWIYREGPLKGEVSFPSYGRHGEFMQKQNFRLNDKLMNFFCGSTGWKAL